MTPPNGPACSTSLQATAALGACTATVMCLDHYSTTITRLRFMAFIGCDTANSGAGGANLLNTAIYTDGVSIALGFTDSIYFGFPSDGGEWYTQYLASNMALGQTVLQAHNNAVQVVRNNNLGFAYGYDGFILKNGQYKTHPAAYGS